MMDEKSPKELVINEDDEVVVEEGYDVAEGEGDNGIKVGISVEKT